MGSSGPSQSASLHKIYRVQWIFFHMAIFPFFYSLGLGLWSFFFFQLSLTCVQMHIPRSRCLKQIQTARMGQDDCMLPVLPSACPRTGKSLVQVQAVCCSFFLHHVDSACFRGFSSGVEGKTVTFPSQLFVERIWIIITAVCNVYRRTKYIVPLCQLSCWLPSVPAQMNRKQVSESLLHAITGPGSSISAM